MSKFQENLRAFRERNGVTAKEFAAKLDMPYTKYIAYENKGVEPKYDTLIKIASALHVSIDDLLGYKQDRLKYWLDFLGEQFDCVPCFNFDSEITDMITLCYWPKDDLNGDPILQVDFNKEELINLLEVLGKTAQERATEITRDVMRRDIISNILHQRKKNTEQIISKFKDYIDNSGKGTIHDVYEKLGRVSVQDMGIILDLIEELAAKNTAKATQKKPAE